MKDMFIKFYILIFTLSSAFAQNATTLEEQINKLWIQKNYAALQTLFDEKTSVESPDVVALYCAKFFYVFVQPDKSKALTAATKLKVAAEATTNKEFISFANQELADVKAVPDNSEPLPLTELLTLLHTEFPADYPNVKTGVSLRKYKNPNP
jgi:predicted negative regulator of RcsB-dependent stress response